MQESLPSIIIFSIVLAKLDSVIKVKCVLDLRLPVLAGVSGGPDSLCMLDVLRQLGYSLVVAHLDHGLRPESAQEAERLRQLAEQAGLPFVLERADVPGYADSHGLSTEEAARELRYRFLFAEASRRQAQAVAVGHTADDQVETVLMHLLRGSGLAGLRGMSYRSLPNPWSVSLPLVRPLLGTWREEILEYIGQRDLQPSQDLSNLDVRYYRNRLRHELVPQLEKLNPGARSRLWQMADILGEDEQVLEQVEQAAWLACQPEQGQSYVSLDVKALHSQPLGLKRRLLRRAIECLRPGLRDIDFPTVERLLRFLDKPALSGQSDLAAGLRMQMEAGRLWLAAWEADLPGTDWPQVPHGAPLWLDVALEKPAEIALEAGWRLQVEILEVSRERLIQARSNRDPYQSWLDRDKLTLPLQVRTRLPGERFSPLGMDGHSLKISDFMINMSLPRRARLGWPLVVSNRQVAWVPGYRMGENFAVSENTRQIVHLSLLRAAY
jgi:tRNA(Ile)-lysidine synthase